MKTRSTTIILALFLGGIGIHRFYLGNHLIGFLYLIFAFTWIPMIISLIEAIHFGFMKDEDFNTKYNADYMMKMDYIKNRK